jgi:hypothetical protein
MLASILPTLLLLALGYYLPNIPTGHPLALLFSAIFIGFGVLYFLRPETAVTFFALPWPKDQADQDALRVIFLVLGAKDLFVGFSFWEAMYHNQQQMLGLLEIGAATCAVVDGWACYRIVGKGYEGHWGYAPVLGALGLGTVMGWL